MTAPAGQIRKGRKFDQVLDGAREVFMRDGFEGASVDEIARASGVSKATLYSYFPDKRLLFAEVARCESLRQAEAADEIIGCCDDPAVALREAGGRMIAFFTSNLGLSIFRICAAESNRFPELGAHFYDSGPKMVRERLVEYFHEAVEAGQLAIEDFDLAADQFAELCKSSFFPRILCGVQQQFSKAELDRVLDGAVTTFLARYGAAR